MALIKWDPFAELNTLHEQLNQAFSDSFGHSRSAQFSPVTDVYSEDDKQMTVEVHLPNFDEDDVTINLQDGALEISAQHHEKTEDKGEGRRTYLLRESSSSFYRRIALPKQADEEAIKATFNKGVLKVTIPFKALPKPKKIAIGAKAKTAGKDKADDQAKK